MPSDSAVPSVSASASASVTASAKPTHTKHAVKPTPKSRFTQAAAAPVKPLAKKPYTQVVKPKPPIKLDTKQQVFEKEFTRQTGFTPAKWDEAFFGDPLSYKIDYKEMLAYAKGYLCSSMLTGLDDFTLGGNISQKVSYLTEVQTALISATRKAYGCKAP